MKRFKKHALGALMLTASFASAAAAGPDDSRRLSFHNVHTGEDVSVTYYKNGAYDTREMQRMNHFMRDYRTSEQHAIDPRLLDIVHHIKKEIQQTRPNFEPVFEVISGYRSSETNEGLRSTGAKVAKSSQHSEGTAMDIRVNGIPLQEVRDSAWCQQRGGVGYYPETHNNFVHVDTSRVRFWPAQNPKWRC